MISSNTRAEDGSVPSLKTVAQNNYGFSHPCLPTWLPGAANALGENNPRPSDQEVLRIFLTDLCPFRVAD